jgi:hypothetical protein
LIFGDLKFFLNEKADPIIACMFVVPGARDFYLQCISTGEEREVGLHSILQS